MSDSLELSAVAAAREFRVRIVCHLFAYSDNLPALRQSLVSAWNSIDGGATSIEAVTDAGIIHTAVLTGAGFLEVGCRRFLAFRGNRTALLQRGG
jgi:hypothetical protein